MPLGNDVSGTEKKGPTEEVDDEFVCDSDELLPFYTYRDLYLRPIHKVRIQVDLPKLRQLGQSISNWEIRERLKKMLGKVELSDFKVQESTLEEVVFVATVNTGINAKTAISLLNGITFRAIGFTEPLSVKAECAKPDFPTRIDWDAFFASNKNLDEKEPGERPDTVYISGLPFDWFKDPIEGSTENTFKHIFAEYGEVICVDIPQCDPIRKEMDQEISGIQLSSWLLGQDPFFEVYIQFREYVSFAQAMAFLGGKNLVQKNPNGEIREAKIRVDFDRTSHLSIRKITQRKLRRMCLEYERDKQEQKKMDESKRLEEMIREEKEKRDRDERERVMRALLRAERRQRMREKRDFEQLLRKKLKHRLTHKLEKIWKERQKGAKALLRHIAEIYREKQQLEKQRLEEQKALEAPIHELASAFVREQGLPMEEEIRQRILRKQELKMRTRITSRMISECAAETKRKGYKRSQMKVCLIKMKGNKFGLTIQKKPEEDKQTLKPSSVFDTNSDDDNDEKETNDEKFQRKYAVPTKLKDKKILEKAIAEDPTIFDYDSQYEEMQKPKYAHKLIETHKRRELEKLLHDERTYKKEREKEAGEFDDKEVFITGEYRKQIEERESFRKELEELDKMDEIRDVKNQKLWQQAFHRKILEDRARVFPDTSQKEENNIKEEENEEKILIKNKKENEEIIKEEIIEETGKEGKIKENYRENEDKYERGRRGRSNSPKKFKRISDDSKSEKNERSLPSFIPSIDDEMNEEIRRMEKIRQILRRRNDENAVAVARLRYFERREQGEIVPPF
ncbi:unnamed protein product [Meloidogyne enterolobii]|uniref:Uncharacterized protein n=2 Tax=Meloidogyne enterolobii TaxID=390850 RepID=A0ACB0ZIK8_MELEN